MAKSLDEVWREYDQKMQASQARIDAILDQLRNLPVKPDRCPPHNFKAAWASEDRGVLFCSLCGDVRDLAVQQQPAPVEESDSKLFGSKEGLARWGITYTMPEGDTEDFAPGQLK